MGNVLNTLQDTTWTIPPWVGFLGLVHDHVWGLRKLVGLIDQAIAQPGATVVAASDPNGELLARAKAQYGMPNCYRDHCEMLEREELDVVVVASPHSDKASVVEAAAAKGVDCIVEKPMAARLSEANRMLAAASESNARLMMSWPIAWKPGLHEAHELVDRGCIGKVLHMAQRSANPGPRRFGARDCSLARRLSFLVNCGLSSPWGIRGASGLTKS